MAVSSSLAPTATTRSTGSRSSSRSVTVRLRSRPLTYSTAAVHRSSPSCPTSSTFSMPEGRERSRQYTVSAGSTWVYTSCRCSTRFTVSTMPLSSTASSAADSTSSSSQLSPNPFRVWRTVCPEDALYSLPRKATVTVPAGLSSSASSKANAASTASSSARSVCVSSSARRFLRFFTDFTE